MNKVYEIISKHPASYYILACSAGVDSMVLFHTFLAHRLPFSVAHVNYKLRGEDSEADARMIRELCMLYHIPFYERTLDLGEQLTLEGGNLQQEARTIRYEFFKELVDEAPDVLIVTAHHQDDQIETFFLHLFRNSGLAGLAGMHELRGGIFRPFLTIPKSEIIAYAQAHGIRWREDKSNTDSKYQRNAIRLDVIPTLEKLNPSIKEQVLILQNACYQSYLEVFEQAKALSVQWKNQGFIPITDLAQDLALLVEAFKMLEIEPRFIPSIMQLADAENNKRVDLAHNSLGYQGLIKFKDKLYLIDDTPCIDFSFSVARVDALPAQFNTFAFFLDPLQVEGELKLVRGKSMESFVPVGMNSTKTVNAILKDHGIPAFHRLDWPVLCMDDQLIGIPGVSLNRAFSPKPTLPSYLKVTFTAC
jgi:tRNA(Ile)-lysidine synthase